MNSRSTSSPGAPSAATTASNCRTTCSRVQGASAGRSSWLLAWHRRRHQQFLAIARYGLLPLLLRPAAAPPADISYRFSRFIVYSPGAPAGRQSTGCAAPCRRILPPWPVQTLWTPFRINAQLHTWCASRWAVEGSRSTMPASPSTRPAASPWLLLTPGAPAHLIFDPRHPGAGLPRRTWHDSIQRNIRACADSHTRRNKLEYGEVPAREPAFELPGNCASSSVSHL